MESCGDEHRQDSGPIGGSGGAVGSSGVSEAQAAFAATQGLAKLAQRNMRLHCTMQDGQMWVADSERSVAIEPQVLRSPDIRRQHGG